MTKHLTKGLKAIGLVLLTVFLTIACSSAGSSPDNSGNSDASNAAETTPADVATAANSYHKTIRPLLEQHCISCHTNGGTAPFDLNAWESVSQYKSVLVYSVQERRMPPWFMKDSCRPVEDSMRLSDEEIEQFTLWAADGYAKGSPSDYVAPEVATAPSSEVDLGEPSVIMTMPIEYTPDTSTTDDYRCFIIPDTFPVDRFIKHFEVRPDNDSVVHHVIVFTIPEGKEDALAALDAEDETPGYTCFGDPGVDSAAILAGWAPGAKSLPSTGAEAQRIPAGSTLVMQMHYNFNTLTETDEPPTDQSALALWYLPEGETPDFLIYSVPIANMEFNVPAGEESSTQEAFIRMPVNGFLVGTTPHMHLLGTDMRTDMIRPDGSEECLTDLENWDFGWQRTYMYQSDYRIPFSIDDQIRIRCTYNNSASNQPFVGGIQAEPKNVGWGEGSLDEMCLNFLVLATPYTKPETNGVCAGFRPCFESCPEGDGMCALTCMGAAGEGCILCGSASIFGPCLVSNCLNSGVALNACAMECPNVEAGFFECIYETCRSEFDTYYTCIDPLLRENACADDFSTCKGVIIPEPEEPSVP